MDVSLRVEPMSGAFTKWHIDGLPLATVLHRFTEPDHGDPHDHPWPFRSVILSGGYVEEVYHPQKGLVGTLERKPGDSFLIGAKHIHRIVSLPEGECWTLIMPGEHQQTSGFWRFDNGQAFHRFWHEQDFKPVEREAA